MFSPQLKHFPSNYVSFSILEMYLTLLSSAAANKFKVLRTWTSVAAEEYKTWLLWLFDPYMDQVQRQEIKQRPVKDETEIKMRG